MSRGWRRGSTTAWRRVRASVLARDGHRCMTGLLLSGQVPAYLDHLKPHLHLIKQSAKCTGRDAGQLQAHHVLGVGRTGMDPKWVVTVCRECNLGMGDPMRRDPRPMSVTRW